MNIQYKNDLQHSCLEVSFEETGTKKYEITMLVQNQIGCLASCDSKKINGIRVIRYHVGGKMSLSHYFNTQEMQFSLFCALMNSLWETMEAAEHYLLDVKKISIHPDYIFLDKGREVFQYCYFPEQTEDIVEAMKHFSEKLLTHLDYTDEKMVQQAYLLYRKTHEENFELGKYVETLAEDNKMIEQEGTQDTKELVYHMETMKDNEQSMVKETQKQYEAKKEDESVPIEFWNTEEMYEEDTKIRSENLATRGKQEGRKKATETELKESKKKGFYNKWFGKGEREKKGTKPILEPAMPSYASEEAFFYGSDFTKARKEQFATSVGLNSHPSDKQKLVSLNSNKGKDYVIESYPYVIGSLSYAVDAYIDDIQISRFHARIDKREQAYYLTDLNTKSGTFLNGERIEVNGVRQIQRGDIIGIGDYQFRFL